jgi:Ni,Fe-hydrogenase maturation factor
VVNGVREQLEQAPLDPLDDGFNDLGRSIDTVVLHQLVPEMAEIVADYDMVIFIDAHVADLSQLLCEERVTPAYRSTSFVSHQTHPATVLELAEKMYGHAPQGVMLSLRGHDFDFGEGLSRETATLVSLAVERILSWAQTNPVNHKHNHLSLAQKR